MSSAHNVQENLRLLPNPTSKTFSPRQHSRRECGVAAGTVPTRPYRTGFVGNRICYFGVKPSVYARSIPVGRCQVQFAQTHGAGYLDGSQRRESPAMNAPDLARDSIPYHFRNWPSIGGLIAAGIVAFLMCGFPPRHFLSLGQLIGSAVERVFVILSASAVTICVLGAMQRAEHEHPERLLMLRTTFDALWFAPLALFVCEDSGWAAAIIAVLVVSIIKSFRCHEDHSRQVEDEATPAYSLAGTTIEVWEAQSWFFPQLSALCAAMLAQSGAAASVVSHPFAGAILVGIGSAIGTWSFTADASTDERELRLSAQRWRTLLVLMLTILFTAVGLARYLVPGHRFAGFGIPSRHHARRGFSQPEQHQPPGGEGMVSGPKEAYSGIVLWPNKTAFTKLIAPLLGGNMPNTRRADPLIIPFDGVYWFFKAPDLHLPANSREARGSPETFDIRSTDGRSLSMEAHQNLGTTIDLGCCSRIQVAIRNADRYPQTVAIELRLMNTALPRKPSQSLGEMQVHSTRAWKLYDDRPPTTETLDFAIPPNPLIRRFNEVMVVFRLDADRADAAAKIGIERFVLIPRGL